MSRLHSFFAPSEPAALDALSPADTVTLNNGTQVPSTDPAWRAECLSRFNHIQALRWLRKLDERQQYFADVAHAEGAIAADRLKLAYAADWQARKAAVAAAQAQIDQVDQLRASGAL
ncbi:MAG: hypothetical protein RL375_853 [Pseudomonadota bacterium]|jgi:hypothetical protein